MRLGGVEVLKLSTGTQKSHMLTERGTPYYYQAFEMQGINLNAGGLIQKDVD